VLRTGPVLLHAFAPAELTAVTLDLAAVPPADRGLFLQEVPAPSAASSAVAASSTGGPAASLERAGFLRPGWGSASEADGLAGWLADPAGPQPRQPVTLLGDLAIITRVRAQPVWLAEVSISAEPTRPDPQRIQWRLIARVYAAFRPPIRLIERPQRADGTQPPFAALSDDQSLGSLIRLCGADAPAKKDAASALRHKEDHGATPAAAATDAVAGEFSNLARLRVVLADGQGVLLRSLLIASAPGRSWLLEGVNWELARQVRAAELADRVSAMLTSPAGAR
jgi:hypothetical protein